MLTALLAPLPPWRLAAGGADAAQPEELLLDALVGLREQGLAVGVFLDHVAQVAEVVDQQLHGTLALGLTLESGEQVENQILNLGTLDSLGEFEGAGQRDAARRLGFGSFNFIW